MNFYLKPKHLIKFLFSNRTARLNLYLLFGTLINSVYIFSNILSALVYHSIWSATLTAYHLMLIIIRIYILSQSKNSSGKKMSAICFRVGVLLLFLDLTSAVLMIYSVRRGLYSNYSGVILLGFLSFAIYSVAKSIISMKKHKNDNKYLHFVVKNLSLSTSLMSVFNLQYSLFSFFGANSYVTTRAIFLCGALVFSVILSLSISLIRRSKSADFQ